MRKKILIIGNSAKGYALAKALSSKYTVYVTPSSDTIKEFATCLDIREDSISELLEFAMENDINLTIPVSRKALESNISESFIQNNLQIFAPSYNATKLIYDKTAIKKILYKLRIPTPKFGIFEKQNMAQEYIKNLKTPFVIKTNHDSSAVTLTSQKTAKIILDSLFQEKNQKVLIEDYIWGTPFAFYVITDGYKALPIGSSIMYKYSLDGDGGQLTTGMGSCTPNYKLSVDNEFFIMDNIVYPILEYFETNKSPYLGILEINCILTEEGDIQVLGMESFLQDSDCTSILELLDIDIIDIMESCIIGSFSDEMDFIPQKDLSAVSVVLQCKNKEKNSSIISGIDCIDEEIRLSYFPNVKKNRYLEYETDSGSAIIATALSRTVSSSRKKVYQEIENIKFKGLYYRKDICKPTNTTL